MNRETIIRLVSKKTKRFLTYAVIALCVGIVLINSPLIEAGYFLVGVSFVSVLNLIQHNRDIEKYLVLAHLRKEFPSGTIEIGVDGISVQANSDWIEKVNGLPEYSRVKGTTLLFRTPDLVQQDGSGQPDNHPEKS
ncbi:MAG: hypothetical protein AAGJ81_12165 [Verrucomicrobiota bacterium]